MKRMTSVFLATAASLLTVSAQASAIPGNWSLLSSTGIYGQLRAGSQWLPAPPLANQGTVVDDVFLAEGTQWNLGTWWWDQDPTVNGTYSVPMGLRIDLINTTTFDRFVVQADDNDTYQLDYWDGSNWQSAFSIAAASGGGMRTRDSGILASSITTNQLRFYATGGDNYYSVSEIQGFAPGRVPEPHSLALLALGLAAAAGASRRARS